MTGETLVRDRVADDGLPVFKCKECGGESRTRMPNHELDCGVIA